MIFVKLLLFACALGISLEEINGHGMMMSPVSRSSAWREGFPVEINYNDNELFCGGFQIQMEQNGGKCGECGDNYALPRPRPNDNGGIYGLGIIVKKYSPNEIINVKVQLTANHRGTFRFNLCQLMNEHHVETEECFDEHPLQLADGSYELSVPPSKAKFDIPIRLPANFTCEHCVLRWHYRTGNNWGECEDGSTGLGCGPQETFRNCADVSILPPASNSSSS
ncbi:uncharacterized protein LOC117602697 [Osmia lignaria lignaria]|uniref:uncharacterized protein LOC117602697 n=1 Tax=Osmia lignaria lignaria TaxID=1437193 RepID=UPI00402B1A4E